jgi:hypothetical protein
MNRQRKKEKRKVYAHVMSRNTLRIPKMRAFFSLFFFEVLSSRGTLRSSLDAIVLDGNATAAANKLPRALLSSRGGIWP